MSDQEKSPVCADCTFLKPSDDPKFGVCENASISDGEGFNMDALWPKRRYESVACAAFSAKAG